MKVVGAGWVRCACASTVGLPCFLGPLKIVIGEEAGIGADSAKLITALPTPVTTIAPGQSAPACLVVVATSFDLVQPGRPLVTTEPCLSKKKMICLRIGGVVPSTVLILPLPLIVIGAYSCFGRVVGENPPSVVTTML